MIYQLWGFWSNYCNHLKQAISTFEASAPTDLVLGATRHHPMPLCYPIVSSEIIRRREMLASRM
jgi:hypothetical protein